MTPEEEKELTEHINAIGKILYKQAKPEQVETQRVRADRAVLTHQSLLWRHERFQRSQTTGKALLSALK